MRLAGCNSDVEIRFMIRAAYDNNRRVIHFLSCGDTIRDQCLGSANSITVTGITKKVVPF